MIFQEELQVTLLGFGLLIKETGITSINNAVTVYYKQKTKPTMGQNKTG